MTRECGTTDHQTIPPLHPLRNAPKSKCQTSTYRPITSCSSRTYRRGRRRMICERCLSCTLCSCWTCILFLSLFDRDHTIRFGAGRALVLEHCGLAHILCSFFFFHVSASIPSLLPQGTLSFSTSPPVIDSSFYIVALDICPN